MKKIRLAALLRQIRLDANLTQLQLAEKIGQTQSSVVSRVASAVLSLMYRPNDALIRESRLISV